MHVCALGWIAGSNRKSGRSLQGCILENRRVAAISSLLSDVFGLVMTFFVSAVVWITLAAGLYQLVRKEIDQMHVTPPQRLELEGYSHQAS